jgi:hypothetical protein
MKEVRDSFSMTKEELEFWGAQRSGFEADI